MIWTTGPSLVIALILFLVLGLTGLASGEGAGFALIQDTIKNTFNISILSFIPLLVVFGLAMKKMPAFPTVLIGALLGGLFAVLLQPGIVSNFVNSPDLSGALTMLSGVWTALHSGFVLNSGVEAVSYTHLTLPTILLV